MKRISLLAKAVCILGLVVTSALFSGCGGGGGGGGEVGGGTPAPTNHPPVASAGPDQAVATGTPVVLNGSGSSDPDGNPLTYAWSLTGKPAGSSAAIANASSVTANLTPDVDGRYTVQLVVNDGTVASPAATMVVTATTPSGGTITPTSGHPRLWLRAADVSKFRSWAVPSNPVYQDGLLQLATQAKADMDAGLVPGNDSDNGGVTYVDYPAEQYAELFAFMSLLSADAATRDDYAQRARTLLMYIMNKAVLGAAEGQPYRDPRFSTNDRSRWQGEAFSLTVDWIYPYLSAAEKATIRTVFLRWIDENLNASITGHDHPEPIGTINDPTLVSDTAQVRWSLNNYWTAHMRNIGQMALSLDPVDDPDGSLRGSLKNALGAWLYVFDYGLRHDAKGGLMPEGPEYGPQTLGYAAQFLLALHTAGMDDPALYGPQVTFQGEPFWNDLVTAFLHSASPRSTMSAALGKSVYLPAWYGDGQHYNVPDFIEVFGPLGIYFADAGNTGQAPQLLNALRWVQTNMPPGGSAALASRVADSSYFHSAILYFLMLDPTAAGPTDPRPALAVNNLSSGLGRILARTDWSENAAWFTYKLSWNQIDHQYGDGNQFEFYRKGEWLTKERTGYDLDYGAPQNHNTLALENDPPDHNDPCAYRNITYLNGGQWAYSPTGDPNLAAASFTEKYVYALGDATNLYNSASELSTDILYASRAIVWLKPDHLIVYDRAGSKTAGRFKRFWLNTPALGVVSGNRTTAKSDSGQQLILTTLLPAAAQITAEADTLATCPDDTNGWVASDEPMNYRIKVEAPGKPNEVRFLNVIQGADAGVAPDSASTLHSTAGTAFDGVTLKNTAILFPVDFNAPFSGTTFTVPATTTSYLVTGLAANHPYTVSSQTSGVTLQVSIQAATDSTGNNSDSGGVLSGSLN